MSDRKQSAGGTTMKDALESALAFLKAVEWDSASTETDAGNVMEEIREALRTHGTELPSEIADELAWLRDRETLRYLPDPIALERVASLLERLWKNIVYERHIVQRAQEQLRSMPQSATETNERVAQITAHRACCGTEHDAANGKLHGYCVVCGVPWPCEYAGTPPAKRTIDIVFDGPPSHESGRFVEVESPAGKSIRFGEWVQREDGYWVLRFTVPASWAKDATADSTADPK
jgi:hypothetical protein